RDPDDEGRRDAIRVAPTPARQPANSPPAEAVEQSHGRRYSYTSGGPAEALERAPGDPRVPPGLGDGAPDLRRDRRAALRHELVVRLDAPPPADPALAPREGGPLLRPLLARGRSRRHRRRVRVAVSATPRAPRRGVDAPIPGRFLVDPAARQGRPGRPHPGDAQGPGRPVPLRGGAAPAHGRGAGGPRAAAVDRRRHLARVLLPAASPRVRALPARPGAGAAVRAVRPRPGRRDGAHLEIRRRGADRGSARAAAQAPPGGARYPAAPAAPERGARRALPRGLPPAGRAVPRDRPLALAERRRGRAGSAGGLEGRGGPELAQVVAQPRVLEQAVPPVVADDLLPVVVREPPLLPDLVQPPPRASGAVGKLAIARVRAAALHDLVLELGVGAHREMQDLDRAVVQALPQVHAVDPMVALDDGDLGVGAVGHLRR